MAKSASDRHPKARRALVRLLAAGAFCVGIVLISRGLASPQPPPQPAAVEAFTPRSGPDGVPRHTAVQAPVVLSTPAVPTLLVPAVPTRIRIAAIGVDAPLTGQGLDPGGRLTTPDEHDRNLAGWYRGGTSPGVVGTAIVVGHVDTHQGPAVFYRLGGLKKGDTVDVDRSDQTTAEFTVDAVEAYDARSFPDQKVYGAASRAELRLITCGAGFDKARQVYLGNVVAYAHLTGPKQR